MRLLRRGESASTIDLLVVGLGNPGREYAEIGSRLYTEHAVERMLPSGMGGRSIAPAFVEEAIATGSTTTRVVGGAMAVASATSGGSVSSIRLQFGDHCGSFRGGCGRLRRLPVVGWSRRFPGVNPSSIDLYPLF